MTRAIVAAPGARPYRLPMADESPPPLSQEQRAQRDLLSSQLLIAMAPVVLGARYAGQEEPEALAKACLSLAETYIRARDQDGAHPAAPAPATMRETPKPPPAAPTTRPMAEQLYPPAGSAPVADAIAVADQEVYKSGQRSVLDRFKAWLSNVDDSRAVQEVLRDVASEFGLLEYL